MILTAIRQRGEKQMRGFGGLSSASVIILGQQLADRSEGPNLVGELQLWHFGRNVVLINYIVR